MAIAAIAASATAANATRTRPPKAAFGFRAAAPLVATSGAASRSIATGQHRQLPHPVDSGGEAEGDAARERRGQWSSRMASAEQRCPGAAGEDRLPGTLPAGRFRRSPARRASANRASGHHARFPVRRRRVPTRIRRSRRRFRSAARSAFCLTAALQNWYRLWPAALFSRAAPFPGPSPRLNSAHASEARPGASTTARAIRTATRRRDRGDEGLPARNAVQPGRRPGQTGVGDADLDQPHRQADEQGKRQQLVSLLACGVVEKPLLKALAPIGREDQDRCADAADGQRQQPWQAFGRRAARKTTRAMTAAAMPPRERVKKAR